MSYFTQSIPRNRLTRSHELSGLDSIRESDSGYKLWRKFNPVLSRAANMTANSSEFMRQMLKLRRPSHFYPFHPFKIYNVPPENCETPADSWRTFQVRDGLVGVRSKKSVQGHQMITTTGGKPFIGNYEIMCSPRGTDGDKFLDGGCLVSAGQSLSNK